MSSSRSLARQSSEPHPIIHETLRPLIERYRRDEVQFYGRVSLGRESVTVKVNHQALDEVL